MDLLDAARYCSLDEVQEFIQQGADVNAVNRYGQSALFFACEHGDYDVAEFLLKNGALVNHRAKPLITAVRNGHVNCVDLLLKHGADVYSRNMKEETAMSVAVEEMNVSVILLLIDHGARPQIPLDCLFTKLFSCAKAEDAEMLRTMLNSGSLSIKSDECLVAAFQFAFTHRSLELASDLMSRHSGSNMEQVYPQAVYYSIRNNWCDILTELLKKGVDVNIMIELRTPLYAACKQHAEDAVALLLQNGADCNLLCQTREGRKETALHVACSTDDIRQEGLVEQNVGSVTSGKNVQVVKLLLKHGANVNAVCSKGETALYRACESRQVKVVQLLLDAGADVNLTTSQAYPLIVACTVDCLAQFGLVFLHDHDDDDVEKAQISSSVAVIRLLLESGANVNSKCPTGGTALHRAIHSGLTDAVRLLLEVGADVGDYIESSTEHPLIIACSQGSAQILDLLLQRSTKSNFSSPLTNLLDIAVEKGFIDVADVLIKHGADVNKATPDGKTALVIAYERRNFAAVELLLRSGADPNVKVLHIDPNSYVSRYQPVHIAGVPLLILAARSGDDAVVKMLLQYGAEVNWRNDDGNSVLHDAATSAVTKALVDAGADVNAVNGMGETPLLCATRKLQATDEDNKTRPYHAFKLQSIFSHNSDPDLSTVNQLLDCGADTNTVTTSGESPLYIACSIGVTALVQRMLKCGSKVNTSKDQKSPLIAACKNKHLAVVQLLLNEGADPNVPEEMADACSFALHFAAAGHNIELVNLLLKHGANVNVTDASHNTALHHVTKRWFSNALDRSGGRKVVLDTLLEAGADVNICNSDGESPLYLTVEKGLMAEVIDMLSCGANPNLTTTDKFPLCVACEKHNVPLVQTLLKAGAYPNLTADSDGEVVVKCELPLCIAAENGNLKLAELLLNSGASVNMLNWLGKSALRLALENLRYHYNSTYGCLKWQKAENKTPELLKLLLDHGADVNRSMPDGCSPLLLLLSRRSNVLLSFRGIMAYKEVVGEALKMMISNGANLADSSNNSRHDFMPRQLRIIESLCAWCRRDRVVVDLLKAGAGFQLLAFYCNHLRSTESAVGGFHAAKSVRVCQAAIMAGYVPSSGELAQMQQSVSGEDLIREHVELLSWLNEDRQQAPSLMRQCRVAIRRQLSVASCHRTIIPAIDQLPLPSRLQQYLKFEGELTEIDLSVGAEYVHISTFKRHMDDDYGYDTVRDIVSDYDSD